jgi:hypothetical protein
MFSTASYGAQKRNVMEEKMGFAVVYDCGVWVPYLCTRREELLYSNQSGWFESQTEAQEHANQLNR